ncbi:MAG TPA: hypothetical protein IAC25_01015 [Candidatus Enterenecus stercoripullorum]|nr:hypothetical protein [Candidatus Enterenecus stercoripullorum]
MEKSIAQTLGLSELGMLAVLAVLAIALAVITYIVSSARNKRAAAQAAPGQAAQPETQVPPITPAPGGPILAQCKLVNCDEQTAALIIAIVADTLGDDFNGKQVTSIRPL